LRKKSKCQQQLQQQIQNQLEDKQSNTSSKNKETLISNENFSSRSFSSPNKSPEKSQEGE